MTKKIVKRKLVTIHNYLAQKLGYKNYKEFSLVLSSNKIAELNLQNFDTVSFKVLPETYNAKKFLGFDSIVKFVELVKEFGFVVNCSYAFDSSINVCITHYKFSSKV